jgi:hypothetical protein
VIYLDVYIYIKVEHSMLTYLEEHGDGGMGLDG